MRIIYFRRRARLVQGCPLPDSVVVGPHGVLDAAGGGADRGRDDRRRGGAGERLVVVADVVAV